MWNRGLFALKPLGMTDDRTELTVQFFWQVGRNFKLESRIDLLTEPVSSQGLNLVGDGCWLTCLGTDGSSSRITSGQTFTFSTTDPERLPLPSLAVLEMQWYLQRLFALSGAAGWPSLGWKDDKSEHDRDSQLVLYADGAPQLSSDRVYEWISQPLQS
jgi:hypothetical protein